MSDTVRVPALFPFGWMHVVLRGHLPRWRWYDVGWADIRGCETCEDKKAHNTTTCPKERA